ncbi:MAG: superoxide dismutase [Sulfolobales archaeon]|nr:superoxide dismutase [Sulfolobales archaeon]MCX8186256.1 superoxide dismutase [Sulfolobales archaeon]MDW7969008.1 superoxide dismutase [Sulfolobales archaeon]
MSKIRKLYELPSLPYSYESLEPYISREQLRIHYEIHHKAYVDGANKILQMMDEARRENRSFDVKAALKVLSFNIGGHVLHSIYWNSMAPKSRGGDRPGGRLEDKIVEDFGSLDRFKQEFTEAALTVEGSGWAALTYCRQTGRLIIMQIEKHNTNVYPMFQILLVVDAFEHAYYIDYRNDRKKYLENWWNIVNWGFTAERYERLL